MSHRKWEEISNSVAFGRGDGGEHLGLPDPHDDGAIGEPGELPRLELDEAGADLELLGEGLKDLGGWRGGEVGLQGGGGGHEAEAAAADGAEAELRPFEQRRDGVEKRVGPSSELRVGSHGGGRGGGAGGQGGFCLRLKEGFRKEATRVDRLVRSLNVGTAKNK